MLNDRMLEGTLAAPPPIFATRLDGDVADEILRHLDAVDMPPPTVRRLFGKSYITPRREGILRVTEDTAYAYSGADVQVVEVADAEWLHNLHMLVRGMLAVSAGRDDIPSGTPVVLLLNKYALGDGVDWHSDDDKGKRFRLNHEFGIVSISVGLTATFQFRRKKAKGSKKTPIHKMTLAHGDVVVMPPGMQKEWLHKVPPVKADPRSPYTTRFNITARVYHPSTTTT